MSRYGIGQQIINEQMEKVQKQTRDHTYRSAFSAMMLALHQEFGFDKDQLHRLAVSTVTNINKYLGPNTMIAKLKKLSGFDVDEPVLDHEQEPEEIECIGLDDEDDLEGCEDG